MSASNSVAIIDPAIFQRNVWVFAGDDYATATFVVVPESWKRSCLTIRCEGAADWYLVFGDAALTNQAAAPVKSTVSSNVPAVAAGSDRVAVTEPLEINLENIDPELKARVSLFCPSGAGTDLLVIKKSSGGVRS